MIRVKNVITMAGLVDELDIPSSKEYVLEAGRRLLLIPGVIDPHISFGSIDSRNWKEVVHSAVQGGITTAIELPYEKEFHHSKALVEQKNQRVAKALADLGLSLSHFHYIRYSDENLEEIEHLGAEKEVMKGIVVDLSFERKEVSDTKWDNLFRLAAQEDILIVVNSHNENAEEWPESGESLLEKAIFFTEKWSNRLYVLNVSTQAEVNAIEDARSRSLLVFAETSLQHLYNPDKSDFLFEALDKDLIETVGSGFDINHLHNEQVTLNGAHYSFSDPIFTVPLLYTAVHQKKLGGEKLVKVTSLNAQDILEISKNLDFVLIDTEKENTVTVLEEGRSREIKLRGWPVYTIVQGNIITHPGSGYKVVQLNA